MKDSGYHVVYSRLVPRNVQSGYLGHKQSGERREQGGGIENERKRHSVNNTIVRKRRLRIAAGFAEADRDEQVLDGHKN